MRFENKYAYKIAVHWIDPAGGDLQLYTLEANSATDMRTTEGHVFFAKSMHGTRLHPHSTVIQEGTGVYSFGPPVESIETNYIQQPPQIVPAVQPNAHINNKHDILIPGTFDSTYLPHPSLKAIGRRTTSMAAKFRCLVPKLDYWYFMLLSSLHLS